MAEVKILWADDEIDLLKPQLFFLEKKGYKIETVTNGYDALEVLGSDKDIQVVFLDESMPGITGLETLEKIREFNKLVPIVMITKNEAENLMEQALGSQIDDYLIKPVNPNQILLSLKKIIDNKRLVSEKTAVDYQQEFGKISMQIASGMSYSEWVDLYKRIIDWELKLDNSNNDEMSQILEMQKKQANTEFSRFISKSYTDWHRNEDGPIDSHNLMSEYFFPHLNKEGSNIFVLLDNLRFDQWKVIEPIVAELYNIEDEKFFYSILPTSTQYSRNAIFSGMYPSEIQKTFPQYWLNDNEKGGKNQFEAELFEKQINRTLRDRPKWSYNKIRNNADAKHLQDNVLNLMTNEINLIVYNFIDMLSHARTEMEVLKELASDEKAYRSLTKSWFLNSPLWQSLQTLAEKNIKLFITTDHGTKRVHQPSKVLADRETTTNLRYKVGKNLNYNSKHVLDVINPESVGLPRPNISSKFIFATEDYFFLYPNNYSKFNRMFTDTFQHGGISMEEIICPFITLTPK